MIQNTDLYTTSLRLVKEISYVSAIKKINERSSIIIRTYNQAESIIPLLDKVRQNIPKDTLLDVVILDDDSPDDTGYMNCCNVYNNYNNVSTQLSLKVVHRKKSKRYIPSILEGVKQCQDDFRGNPNSIASKYISGGSISGWPLRRTIISCSVVTFTRYGLRIRNIRDLVSCRFAVPRKILDEINFGTRGYKIPIEILVKEQSNAKRIAYMFNETKPGKNKLGIKVIAHYFLAIWELYRYGQKKGKKDTEQQGNEERKSVHFPSKAEVSSTGASIQLILIYLLVELSGYAYSPSLLLAVLAGSGSNFVLNRSWTFKERIWG
jgi:dolichol-phosphate mannosyltransferase